MKIEIQEIQDLLVKDLTLRKEGDIEISNFDKLKEWLAREIQLLIDHDFQRFLNMLYRIDVDEQKAKKAFADNDPTMRLAELVIARELQKAETRRRYK